MTPRQVLDSSQRDVILTPFISENLHPDEVDNPYTWWIHDPKKPRKKKLTG